MWRISGGRAAKHRRALACMDLAFGMTWNGYGIDEGPGLKFNEEKYYVHSLVYRYHS